MINATGVLLHTNMGRAPLAVQRPAGYTNLELDLGRGQRGDRSAHAGRFLARAGGAEAALVVNNGAAAIFLVLAALAAGREVVVSRGELVEIGGGFRIPDVLESSGARLVEVGTTNRTRLSDYQGALGEDTALLLKVHTSNYRMTGFVAAVGVGQLAEMVEEGWGGGEGGRRRPPGQSGRARPGGPKPDPGRRGPRVGPARRQLPVARSWAARLVGRRTGRAPDAGRGRVARDV